MSTFIDYKQYMRDQGPLLREKFITDKPGVRCWITGETNPKLLLVHHESYQNLYHEKINKDVYVVSVFAHKDIHFLFGVLKLPLIPFLLKKRRQWLRLRYVLTHDRTLTNFLYYFGMFIFT